MFSTGNALFKDNSMLDLIMTMGIYKASQNDIVLKKGERLSEIAYKVLGKRLTNAIIENTGGKVFTSGPTIKTLTADTDKFYNKYGIWTAANFVMEGIETDDVAKFDYAKNYLVGTITE